MFFTLVNENQARAALFACCGTAASFASIAHPMRLVTGGWLFSRRTHDLEASFARSEAKTISAVVPTLNEAEAITETIRRLQQIPEIMEIIVADGDSTDATCAKAAQLGCRVITGTPGRGLQMRAGAAVANGDVVLLVHADTWLPPQAGRAILDSLRDPTVVGGGFWKTFRDASPLMRGSRFRCAVRLLVAGRVMGDQAMFVRREVLVQIGGVPAMPLMEEFELCRQLRRVGRLALAGATVTTSARRFARRGVIRTYARLWRVTIQYYLGVPAEKLRRTYERE